MTFFATSSLWFRRIAAPDPLPAMPRLSVLLRLALASSTTAAGAEDYSSPVVLHECRKHLDAAAALLTAVAGPAYQLGVAALLEGAAALANSKGAGGDADASADAAQVHLAAAVRAFAEALAARPRYASALTGLAFAALLLGSFPLSVPIGGTRCWDIAS